MVEVMAVVLRSTRRTPPIDTPRLSAPMLYRPVFVSPAKPRLGAPAEPADASSGTVAVMPVLTTVRRKVPPVDTPSELAPTE